MSDKAEWRNRIVGEGEQPASQFVANPANWRVHPQNQRDAMRGALNEVGWVQRVIVNRRTGYLIDGHERVWQALQNGDAPVPYVEVDLDEAEEAYVLATLDPIGAMAQADKEQLDALLREVQSGEAGVQAMLSELAEKTGLYTEPRAAPEPKEDHGEELRETWQVERGQVWEIPSLTIPGQCHRLMCGDSTDAGDVARLWGDLVPETVVFDPPYDENPEILGARWPCRDALVFSNYRHLLDCVDGWGRFRCAFVWDGYTSWWYSGWPLARGRFCLWFGESEYDADGAHYGEPEKPRMVKNTRGESMYHPDPRGKHLSTIYGEAEPKQFEGHPHSKPVSWFRMLIANCTRGVVFDPFLGSGTTVVAGEQVKRLCLGMELSAESLAVTLERLSELGLSPVLATR